MASFVPAKSQPLHNFELPPLLKWSKDGKSSGSHKRRRSMMSPPQRSSAASDSPNRYSPLRDYAAATSPRSRSPSPEHPVSVEESMKQALVCEGIKHLAVSGDSEKLSLLREEARRSWSTEAEALRKGKGVVIEHRRNQFQKPAFCSSISEEGKRGKKSKAAAEADASATATAIRKCNLSIKSGSKSSKEEEANRKESPAKLEITEEHGEIDEVGKEGKINNKSDEDIRLWNLRPRNARSKFDKEIVGGENKPQPQLRSSGAKSGKSGGEKREDKEKGEKKEKKKLSINIGLTKEEIEEDIFALTGSKPSRRPKKRPKNVQKQLDLAFPGLWLVSITPESYKVSENSLKV
ncbi:uncharacterized protein LOC131022853 [Salvia miltiorrhiza]|uniref:uncharacterized protein LOC131022853 n=1 Tax=Salvia miltiorrhiza TaxID=226208 RepID=UPI0025AC725E|nr:uncharacterized protein LOC131022853 [Salvia miltiorrhiza]